MKYDERSVPAFLDRSFVRFRTLPSQEVESACERVFARLLHEATRMPSVVRFEVYPVRRRWGRNRVVAVGAAAAVVLAVLFVQTRSEAPQIIDARAVVEMADGSVHRVGEGETIKTDDAAGTMLSLADASRVEMRSQSELAVERADDGLRVQLNKGSVIVNAAARRSGQFYVRTKDLTVTVTGTVFLVEREAAGSRVGVIQGSVRVQQGPTEKNLIQGEQLVSNPAMESKPVPEQIAWSRNADTHIEQLQQTRKTIEERCGASDMRTIWHDNGGFNLRLPLTIWRNYKCQHERDAQRSNPSQN